jgi:hypothetical protein
MKRPKNIGREERRALLLIWKYSFHQQLIETALHGGTFEDRFPARRKPRRSQLKNATKSSENFRLQEQTL